MSPDSKDKPPVFFDATGRRGRRLAWAGWVAAIISTIFGIGFVTSLVISKPAQAPNLPARSYAIAKPELVKKAVAPGLLSQANRLAVQAEDRRMKIRRERRARNEAPSRVHTAILAPQKGRSLAIAFYTNWAGANDASYPALKRALPQLDWVVPSWMALNGPDLEFKTSMDRKALNYIRANKPTVAILPMLQNATSGKWDGAGLARFLADPHRTAALRDLLRVIDVEPARQPAVLPPGVLRGGDGAVRPDDRHSRDLERFVDRGIRGMGKVHQNAQPVAHPDDVGTKVCQSVVLRCLGLEIAKPVADVVHQLQMAQTVRVELLQRVDPVVREARALQRNHDPGLPAPCRVNVGGIACMGEADRVEVPAHLAEFLAQVARLLAVRGRAPLHNAGAGASNPAAVADDAP